MLEYKELTALGAHKYKHTSDHMQFLQDIILSLVIAGTMLMLGTAIVNIFFAVPYVPTKKRVVRRMIEVAGLKKDEVVYDLGCGDGRLLLAAEKEQKVKARGYEVAPIPFLLAKLNQLISHSKAKIQMANFFKTNLGDANVIFCYLGPETMEKLYPKLKQECQKGTRIISNTFQIKGVAPAKVWPRDNQLKLPSLYYYEI